MRLRILVLLIAVVAAVAACAPEDEATVTPPSEPEASATESTEAAAAPTEAPTEDPCAPENLETEEPGTLTIATGEPAFPPWVLNNEPSSGEGFEAAVAYAVAEELGYDRDDVTWTRADFNASIQPGPKAWDFNLQQFSITNERRRAVDFSSPYYDAQQTVIAVADTLAARAQSLEDLKSLKLGAQVGTTSLQAIEEIIQPERQPNVYNNNDEARTALENGQVDAIVVDLPTAFFMVGAQMENGTVVGQLPEVAGAETDQFGLVLDKGSPLTDCVSQAVDALRADGTLDEIEQEWLGSEDVAPVLQ